jgi:N-methylhydantoinase B
MFANLAAQQVELIEAEQPIQILEYEFIEDRAGPGRFRGGAPYVRTYRFLEEAGLLHVRGDRQRIRPYGLYGGRPGKPSANLLNGRPVAAKASAEVRQGDVFRCEWAGGGGWGDPLERDAEAVARDVRNGLISAESARADYGVIVGDEAATRRLRAHLRRARGWLAPPSVLWDDDAASAQAAE